MRHVLTLVIDSDEEPFDVLRKLAWLFAKAGNEKTIIRHDGSPEPNQTGWVAEGFTPEEAEEVLEALPREA